MKNVIITGSSNGFGLKAAKDFADKGNKVFATMRNPNGKNANAKADLENHSANIKVVDMDVTNDVSVKEAMANVVTEAGKIDILINNAGNAHGLATIQDGEIDDWDAMLDINVKGLLYVSKAVIPQMIAQNDGFIVNIGSTAGKEVYKNGNVYCASKFAVNAINKSMRLDLNDYNIRVSAIHPGLVETEFSEVRFKGDTERAKNVYAGFKPLQATDIADIIHFVISRPYHVNIEDLVVFPTAQASATMIHKENF